MNRRAEHAHRLARAAEGWSITPRDLPRPDPIGGLDDRTCALIELGALVALGAGPGSYRRTVTAAIAAGASEQDVIETLTAVAEAVGVARVVAAAAGVSLALGYDVDQDLEGAS